MPKWIHDRADHIKAKNPSMPESEAFAIATQQSHALNKSPKDYGTAKGKRVAKKKYDTPSDDVKAAKPKTKEAARTMLTSLNAAMVGAFSDEMQKIAISMEPAEPTGLGKVRSTMPKGVLSRKTPTYSQAHQTPTSSPMVGAQPVATAPPPVRS